MELLVFALLLTTIYGQIEPRIEWLYPTRSPAQTFNIMDTVWLSWKSNAKNASLNLWCRGDRLGWTNVIRGAGNPFLVPTTGAFPLQFHRIIGTRRNICHVGFYNMTSNDIGPSIGNSPQFFLAFDTQTAPKTAGLKEAHSLTATSTKSSPTPHSTTSTHAHTTTTEGGDSKNTHDASRNSSTSSPELSSSVVAGIVVAVVITVGALAGLGFFIYQRQRKTRKHEKSSSESSEASELPSVFPPSQLDGTARSELPSTESPATRSAGTARSELSSNDSPVVQSSETTRSELP